MRHNQNDHRLVVFVGSSSEAATYYEYACGTLEEQGHVVKGWKSSFEKGEGFLATLLRITKCSDAALLIATPDDVIHYRGRSKNVLRDNVLFEAGLFIGELGPLATGIVLAGNDPVELPTDLSGVSMFSLTEQQKNAFVRDVRAWANKIMASRPRHVAARRCSARVQSIPEPSFGVTQSLLLPRIENLLTQASRGVIELTPEQYFERIRSEVENAADGDQVMAVASSLSTIRWANDAVQNQYIEQNFLAQERGSNVRRLFLFDNSAVSATQAKSIHSHLDRQIPVRCISLESLSVPIEDLVLFETNHGIRAYKAFLGGVSRERVVTAQLLIDRDHCADLRRRFEEIWALAWEPRPVGDSIEVPGLQIPPPARYDFAPGLEMTARWTTVEVITCRSAAKARGHEPNVSG